MIPKEEREYRTGQLDNLVYEISNNILLRLSDLISNLLNSAHDLLFEMSDEAETNEARSHYFELMNDLNRLKPVVAENFTNNIKKYLVPADDNVVQQDEKDLYYDELSLIDDNDMESMILVRSISERASARYREQLSHLEARLEHLTLKTDKVFRPDALEPVNICQAFDDAIAEIFDSTNKKILFGLFDGGVANKLDTLYDSVNNRLIDAGILPQIRQSYKVKKYQQSRIEPTSAANNDFTEDSDQHAYMYDDPHYYRGFIAGGKTKVANPDEAGAGVSAVNTGGSNIGGYAITADPESTYRLMYPVTGQSAEAVSAGQPPGISASMTGDRLLVGSGNLSPGSGDNSQYLHYTAGLPASMVSKVLSNYIGIPFDQESSYQAGADNSEYYPQATAGYFGHDEVIRALSRIQSQPQFTRQDLPHIDGEKIKQALLETIARTSGGAITKRINEHADKTIDFIELVYDAIIKDEEISDAVKALLLRLQIPIIKASMTDHEFFIYDSHPARQLLDKLAMIGIGVTDHTDDVYLFLENIVDDVLSDDEFNSDSFVRALDDLDAFIVEQEEISIAKEAEEQKELLRRHARAAVLKSIRAITVGKTLPESIHPILLKRWPTLMLNHYLVNGKDNNQWADMLLTLRKIVDSVQPVTSAEQLVKITSGRDSLFRETENYLINSRVSEKEVERIMAVYAAQVQQTIDESGFTKEEVREAEEVVRSGETADEIPVEEDRVLPTIPPDVMPGMWYKCYMGENKPYECCKLSVILIEDANLMFVNHKGELILEKTFDEFNDEVARNRTRMIMGHSAFDKAFNTVISKLN